MKKYLSKSVIIFFIGFSGTIAPAQMQFTTYDEMPGDQGLNYRVNILKK